MPDWLRRDPRTPAHVRVSGRDLPLLIRRLPQAKRMVLRLARDGSVRISMPVWGRDADALAFACSRADWLAGQLGRLPVRQPLAPGEMLPYRGRPYRLDHRSGHARRPVITGDAIGCGGPPEGLEGRLRRWLQDEARALFGADLADYAGLAGVPVPALALSHARARWGSCSSRGVVRLNWRLVMAPDTVRRSVVAHEVAHLVHFNHSPRFHALLATIYEGDVAAANRWLKAEGGGLYSLFG